MKENNQSTIINELFRLNQLNCLNQLTNQLKSTK